MEDELVSLSRTTLAVPAADDGGGGGGAGIAAARAVDVEVIFDTRSGSRMGGVDGDSAAGDTRGAGVDGSGGGGGAERMEGGGGGGGGITGDIRPPISRKLMMPSPGDGTALFGVGGAEGGGGGAGMSAGADVLENAGGANGGGGGGGAAGVGTAKAEDGLRPDGGGKGGFLPAMGGGLPGRGGVGTGADAVVDRGDGFIPLLGPARPGIGGGPGGILSADAIGGFGTDALDVSGSEPYADSLLAPVDTPAPPVFFNLGMPPAKIPPSCGAPWLPNDPPSDRFGTSLLLLTLFGPGAVGGLNPGTGGAPPMEGPADGPPDSLATIGPERSLVVAFLSRAPF